MQEYSQEEVVVSGDGCCDSPGKSAKICTYTLMETSKNAILHCETVDKREVHNKSPNMEREAVDCALRSLKERVNVVEVTTDLSTSVTKMLGMLFINLLYWLILCQLQWTNILKYCTIWIYGTKPSY